MRTINQRLAGICAVVFAVLFFLGVTMPGLPDYKVTKKYPDPAAHLTSFYANHGNRTRLVVAAYLMAVAGLVFLVFLSYLRDRLRRAEGEAGASGGLVFAAGAVFVAMIYAGSAAWASIAGDLIFGNQRPPSPDVMGFIPQLGYPLVLIFGMFAAALAVAVTSMSALRTGVLPRWLAYLGFVAAVAMLFSVVFVPMVLFVIWMIAVGITLLRGGPVTVSP
jgi:hypothetical protein